MDNREEMSSWTLVRRYAVPRWMIEQATERRLAGDWAGACAAAHVDVGFDLAEVAGGYGARAAADLEADLRHLAPDLLRWHLPRVLNGRTSVGTLRALVLGRYGDGVLHVVTPPMVDGPQRLRLLFRRKPLRRVPRGHTSIVAEDWSGVRHLWDARSSAGLPAHYGGTGRPPFFHADGTPLAPDELPGTAPDPADTTAHHEWVTLLHERGELEAAFEAAGAVPDFSDEGLPGWARTDPRRLMARLPVDLALLARESRALAERGTTALWISFGWYTGFAVTRESPQDPPRMRVASAYDLRGLDRLPEFSWRRQPDLSLLRAGRITPEELHPLVRDALFPKRPAADGPVGPPGPEAPAPARVRCRGEWHEVRMRDGRFDMPHTAEERQREQAMRAFGGAVTGCFAVREALTGGEGRLPRALRGQRRDLFLRMHNGDTRGVLRLLDMGVDPRVRDGRKRTLLHLLHLVDHEELLPRLLAAGLDLEATDQNGRTPLHLVVGEHGRAPLVRALLDAGARIDVVDESDYSLVDLMERNDRTDLRFLRDRIAAEYPDITAHDYWEYDEDEDPEDEDGE
ncbi:hypothetical protein GCM10009678_94400 [Actinomadura kijaniata]|uniref:Ankyrin repeat domain-containing protein n=2 Tax=Actinomadura TaxID=1988 RepID=A0A7W3LV83_ACTNM|nr:ankyrin repeat domain-containing protein [Actinomadura namibiensis]MBA8954949.1 hypothetical protein [Actinomadura namibiensis]